MRKVLVSCVLALGCAKSEQPTPVASAQPVVSAAPSSKPVRTSVPELAKQLDAIMRKPADFSTSVDKSGTKTVTFNLKPLEGVGLAVFVGVRGQEKAWRFGLEGIRCDRVDELGIEVVEVQHGDGRPLSASWYRIKGGPLEQLLVKVFPGESAGLCNVMPGTPPYWEHQGEKPPSE